MAAIASTFLNKSVRLLLPLIFFFLLTCFVTYPLIFHLHEMLPGVGDQLLVTWIMNWNLHAVITDPFNLFQAPIFYPYQNTLAYSDIFLTSTFTALFPYLILKEPVVFYSWNLILSLTFLGYFTYLLVEYISKNYFSGVIAGTLAAFSIFTLGKIGVLQLITIYSVPLAILFFLLFLQRKSPKYFFLFALSFIFQIYNSFLPAYFIAFSAFFILAFSGKSNILNFLKNKTVLLISVMAILLSLPVIIPYYTVSQEFGYVRDIRDTIAFANRIHFSLYPPDSTILQQEIIDIFFSKNKNTIYYFGYLGLVSYVLIFFVFLYMIGNWKRISRTIGSFLLISASGFVLSLGPALQFGDHIIKKPFIIPLPYVFFYYFFPGFKGMRNSGRWEMLFVLGAAISIGLVLGLFFRSRTKLYQLTFTILVILGAILEINRPLDYSVVETKKYFPETYSYLSTISPTSSIIHLPLYSWDMTPYSSIEFKREYYSVSSFNPMVNGYSGFSPPEWEQRANMYMWEFPSDKIVNYFKQIDLNYLVLHKSEYDTLEQNSYTVHKRKVVSWSNIQKDLKRYPQIKLIKVIDQDYIYKLL